MTINDYSSQVFDKITVIAPTNKRSSNGSIIWLARCECGEELEISSKDLGRKKSFSCDKCKESAESEIGKRYGRLVVIDRAPPPKEGRAGRFWLCQCDCGNTSVVRTTDLRSRGVVSCGCLQREKAREQFTDLTGMTFGRWKVISKTEERTSNRGVKWLCQCSCEQQTTRTVCSTELVRGTSMSCGCLRQSHGEYRIAELLSQNNIKYEMEKRFSTCQFPDTLNLARFDFYVNDSYLIEYDGIQHYKNTYGTEVLERTQERDKYKTEWCKENNIPLIRIPYTKLSTLSLDDLQLNTTEFRVV